MGGRIGILGGTFDPIHCGHVDIGTAAETALDLTELLVMPARVPPHRPQPIASTFHRFAMVALTVAGRPRWRASDLELHRDAPSYTSATLHLLHDAGRAPSDLFFVVGADAFAEVATWKDYPALLDDANFVVVSRTGWSVEDLRAQLPEIAGRMVSLSQRGAPVGSHASTRIFLIDAPTADVSSTAIRQRCASGRPISGLVVAGVEQHIAQHGLYSSNGPGGGAHVSPSHPAAGRLHGEI